VRAFVHVWLSLLEQPAAAAGPVRELLDTDLAMTLSDGRVLHPFDEVAAWYADAAQQVHISTHHLIGLTSPPERTTNTTCRPTSPERPSPAKASP
jgi:hypothetical protein